jgi:hypothetical protein
MPHFTPERQTQCAARFYRHLAYNAPKGRKPAARAASSSAKETRVRALHPPPRGAIQPPHRCQAVDCRHQVCPATRFLRSLPYLSKLPHLAGLFAQDEFLDFAC